jgi:hypothetical protein
MNQDKFAARFWCTLFWILSFLFLLNMVLQVFAPTASAQQTVTFSAADRDTDFVQIDSNHWQAASPNYTYTVNRSLEASLEIAGASFSLEPTITYTDDGLIYYEAGIKNVTAPIIGGLHPKPESAILWHNSYDFGRFQMRTFPGKIIQEFHFKGQAGDVIPATATHISKLEAFLTDWDGDIYADGVLIEATASIRAATMRFIKENFSFTFDAVSAKRVSVEDGVKGWYKWDGSAGTLISEVTNFADIVSIDPTITIQDTSNTGDTYFNSGATTTNYGTDTLLRVGEDNNPFDYRGAVGFNIDLSGSVSSIEQATLTMVIDSVQGAGQSAVDLYALEETTNIETTGTWANQPSIRETIATGVSSANSAGATDEFDILSSSLITSINSSNWHWIRIDGNNLPNDGTDRRIWYYSEVNTTAEEYDFLVEITYTERGPEKVSARRTDSNLFVYSSSTFSGTPTVFIKSSTDSLFELTPTLIDTTLTNVIEYMLPIYPGISDNETILWASDAISATAYMMELSNRGSASVDTDSIANAVWQEIQADHSSISGSAADYLANLVARSTEVANASESIGADTDWLIAGIATDVTPYVQHAGSLAPANGINLIDNFTDVRFSDGSTVESIDIMGFSQSGAAVNWNAGLYELEPGGTYTSIIPLDASFTYSQVALEGTWLHRWSAEEPSITLAKTQAIILNASGADGITENAIAGPQTLPTQTITISDQLTQTKFLQTIESATSAIEDDLFDLSYGIVKQVTAVVAKTTVARTTATVSSTSSIRLVQNKLVGIDVTRTQIDGSDQTKSMLFDYSDATDTRFNELELTGQTVTAWALANLSASQYDYPGKDF